MDLVKEFRPFLVQWCKTNHRPCPPEGVMNATWKLAWEDYMKTTLVENYEQNKEYFQNIKLLTKTELKRLKAQEELEKKNAELIKVNNQEIEEEVEEPQQLSAWEQVKNMM